MWQDLLDLADFNAGLVVAYTRDSLPNINREALDVCLTCEPPRQMLMYSPGTGLQRYDVGTSRFVPFLRDGVTIGQGQDKVGELVNFLIQYHHPYILHLQNFELYCGGQAIPVFLQLAEALKGRKQLALASVQPGVKNFPVQYEGKVTFRNMPLPTASVLEEVVQMFYESNQGLQQVISAPLFRRFRTEIAGMLSGLVEYEAQIAFQWALRETQRIYRSHPGDLNSQEGMRTLIQQIVAYKSGQVLMKNRLTPVDMSRYHPITGADALMEEIRLARATGMLNPNHPFPLKGFGFIGPTGLGKSDLCKMIAHELGMPLYTVNPAALMGEPDKVGTVGAMETAMAAIFDDAEALTSGGRTWIALLFDEFEKLMGGSQISNRVDGGAGARQMQQFLTFATERAAKAGVLLLLTMNSADVPTETLRDGRVSMWGVLPPDQLARGKISFNLLSYMLVLVNRWNKQNQRGPVQIDPRLSPEIVSTMFADGYTGGEIHAALEKALKYGYYQQLTMDNLMKAIVNTPPMAKKEPERFRAQVVAAMGYPQISGNEAQVEFAARQWQGYMPPQLDENVVAQMVQEDAEAQTRSIQKLSNQGS